MAKYKIIPSSRTIVQSPISIGHKAEKGVEAIEFDVTAWVETYGSGTLTVIMRRWGDAIPYPIALEIDEDNKATWVLSDTDTARAGMAYAQLSYIVGETVVKKSDIYTFRVMDSLTGEGEPPEAYESWLEHLTHLAAEAMAEVLDIEGIVTDKTLTVDGGIADAKATGDALALKADKSTTYTKTEVDQMIEDVEVETDTTLAISGAPADAKKVGDELSDIKADLESYSDNVVLVKNLAPVLTDGYINASAAGSAITAYTSSVARAWCCIPVKPNTTYALNIAPSGNFSWWAYASDNALGTAIERVSATNGLITSPANADLLYITIGGGTSETGLVVLEQNISILGADISDYPRGDVKSVVIDKFNNADLENAKSDIDTLFSAYGGDAVVFGVDMPTFGANTATTTTISIPRLYYKNRGGSGDAYVTNNSLANLEYTLTNNQMLVFDYDTLSCSVIDAVSAGEMSDKIVLIWKQGKSLKGIWAWVYYYSANRADITTLQEDSATTADITSVRNDIAVYDRCITRHIHSRQGEGFGYPDNSREGIKAALKNGYRGIRIAVSATSDNVPYCTHSYEMRNNQTGNLNHVTVASTGDVYDGDVYINEVTAEFIETLLYKGYTIPTLESVLSYVRLYDVDVTLEIKDTLTADSAANIIGLCRRFGVYPVYAADKPSNLQKLIAVDTNLDIEFSVIPWVRATADSYYETYNSQCKSIRYALLFTSDAPPSADIEAYHALGCSFRVCGGLSTQAQWNSAILWGDVIEVAGNYHTWMDRLMDETY